MTLDDEGCISLVDILSRMEESPNSSEVSLPVMVPDNQNLKIYNNGDRIKTVSSLLLKCRKTAGFEWQIEKLDQVLTITFNASYASEFKEAIIRLGNKEGDFAISDANETDESIL